MRAHRAVILNLACCAIIGATFGFLSRNLLPWLLGSAAVGAAIGLAEAGYGVLTLDMRAHGESGGTTFATVWDSDQDVLAAVTYLESRPEVEPGRIGALGLSAGATATLYAAAATESIRAIVVDGTPLGATKDMRIVCSPFSMLTFSVARVTSSVCRSKIAGAGPSRYPAPSPLSRRVL